jgi:Myo-inositol-1-phosphate synthase.
MAEKGVDIAPAEGKLGVLLVGLGAVSTTLVAGVEAIKRGISAPIGSLTQMGTIRLGKRTDNRVPKIKDFVPLADINDIVFGAWDIFTDTAFEAAMNAGVLDKDLLNQVSEQLSRSSRCPPFLSRITSNASTVRTSKKARTRWSSPSSSSRTLLNSSPTTAARVS